MASRDRPPLGQPPASPTPHSTRPRLRTGSLAAHHFWDSTVKCLPVSKHLGLAAAAFILFVRVGCWS